MAPDEDAVLAALLSGVCEAARLVLHADGASVALVDQTGADLVFTAAAGEAAGWLVGARFPASEGIAGHVLRTGEAVEAIDMARDPRVARDVGAAIGHSPDAMDVHPLCEDGCPRGVLSVLDPRLPVGRERRGLLEALAHHAEAALRLSRAIAEGRWGPAPPSSSPRPRSR